ncbi:MAG: GNAT family N-acetyltransferase [Verrucomicrobiota bacterium]
MEAAATEREPADALSIRLLKPADFAFADEVRALAGWNQTLADWQRFLDCEPHGCFVAERNGAPAGTATTVYYGPGLGWIGMLLVHPEQRRGGVGGALLRHALGYLQSRGAQAVKLDATPLGQPLYERSGFKPCGALTRYEAPVFHPKSDTVTDGVSALVERDWTELIALDATAFGLPRPEVLGGLVRRSLRTVVCRTGGFGYGMIREGSRAQYLGPVVAETALVAGKIIHRLTAEATGKPLFWDVPASNEAATEFARSLGLAPQRHLLRMCHGDEVVSSTWGLQYAIADPAVG